MPRSNPKKDSLLIKKKEVLRAKKLNELKNFKTKKDLKNTKIKLNLLKLKLLFKHNPIKFKKIILDMNFESRAYILITLVMKNKSELTVSELTKLKDMGFTLKELETARVYTKTKLPIDRLETAGFSKKY